MSPVLVLLALLGGSGGPGPAACANGVEIEGNLVLVDEVYLAALDLPSDSAPTQENARRIERQVLAFLRRAGYALATVRGGATGGCIRIVVDEGRLSRIAVVGRDVVSTLAVRLQLGLPNDVFNRPQLERLLQRYRDRGSRVSYRLVPARVVAHRGPQVDPLALLPGGEPLPPASAYELHIQFTGTSERSGLSLIAGIDPDSIRAGGVLSSRSVLLGGDRWEFEVQIGANFFEDLERQVDELRFSRVLTDARWLAPTIALGRLRPTVRLREDLLRRQRQDLAVQTYWWNRLEGAIGLSFVPAQGIELAGELGAQRRDLFSIEQLSASEVAGPVEPESTLRAFAALTGRFLSQPERLRLDRRERIAFEGRYFPGLGGRAFGLADAQYRRVFEFGWNDLWLRAAAGAAIGAYEIADAIPMTGRYLRGVYGHQFYLDRAASIALEYRLSLSRDLFKVGFFHEAAVYRTAKRPALVGEVGWADSFGPSFHALVVDVLQVDLYYAAGFTDDGEFDHGVSLRLEKAF